MPHCGKFNHINGIRSFLSIVSGYRSLTFTENREQNRNYTLVKDIYLQSAWRVPTLSIYCSYESVVVKLMT